ncbi:ABC transporter permease [Janibacter cremeus]|uniref:Putative ABC transport system permease protein n=1 Tax=Janibacter cremeus TaxID=1285192 RepID=A0A852VQ41_9MICO|nr:ABC transporter permease [Janibacter cremeus]NYF97858.1 putative ABC transport system permease protein [Janibacter cremeus]
MLKASIKSLLARKTRLLMSAMAIILGTAFVAGSLVFTDTLERTFDGIFAGTVGDVVVQPEQVDDFGGSTGATLTGDEVAAFADLPGAARADGTVEAMGVFVVGENGNVVGGQGAPAQAFNYNDAPNQFGEPPITVTSGRAPTAEGEVAVDEVTLEQAGYEVGDEITLVSAGDRPQITATVVGALTFGEGGMAGASISVFDTKTMQSYFMDGKDEYTSAWVTAKDGVDNTDLVEQAEPLTPDAYETLTGADLSDRNENSLEQALGFITTFLLVFAGVALFVGSFLIVNTFGILVAQRGRELALLRAIGASRRQVTRSVLVEALVIGVIGATLGLGLGVLLALGIRSLFATFGLDLSGTGLVFKPRTVIATYVVGILVTMLAAWLPARRAGSVAPVAAMRDTVETARSHPIRSVLEVGVLVLGLLAFLFGLFVAETRELWWIGGGIAGLVLGTAFLAPFVGRPVISGLGWVYRRLFGSIGRMAEQNTVRSPGRTAATASALMIGMTLVALMGVIASSANASIDKQIEESFRADYVLSNAIGQPYSSQITAEAAKVDGVRAVSPIREVRATVDGGQLFSAAIDPRSFDEIEELEMAAGSADIDADSILLSTRHQPGRQVGDTAEVTIGGQTRDLEIAGFFGDSPILGSSDVILSLDTVEAMGGQDADRMAFVFVEDGADREAVAQDIKELISAQPLVTLKDQDAFANEQRGFINQLLYLIYALLGLAIVIAVLGIVNTLGLSVLERTREVGLLRAVGLSRRQLQGMIWLESIAIALLGALLGIVLGVVSGVAIQRALAEDGITELAIPWAQLALFVGLAGIVGVLAAVIPAWRASRMDVLEAIATE